MRTTPADPLSIYHKARQIGAGRTPAGAHDCVSRVSAPPGAAADAVDGVAADAAADGVGDATDADAVTAAGVAVAVVAAADDVAAAAVAWSQFLGAPRYPP